MVFGIRDAQFLNARVGMLSNCSWITLVDFELIFVRA